VVVLDYVLPDLNGAEVLRHLRTAGLTIPVLIYSGHDDPDYVHAAFAAGASGYVSKMKDSIFLLQAIRVVAQGGICSSAALADGPGVPSHALKLERRGNKLHARTWEALAWLAKGCSNREIATHMGIAESTVRFHLQKIYRHLQLSRGEALAWAVRAGLGKQSD
jgi:DNA-binding NarL/FixJ family response regulator